MPFPRIELSPRAEAMAGKLGLDKSKLVGLIGDILEVGRSSGRDISGNIVCGLDVNGPIVDCDDSELTPYPGASEAISYLIAQQGIEVTLCTGWDLNTMEFFKENRLEVADLGTVGEYGMVYERKGKFNYLYPYNEDEALRFVKDLLEAAAAEDVKVALQGNYSTGAGAIYIEGDTNGNLLEHPLVKGRRPTMKRLAGAMGPESKVTYDEKAGRIRFSSDKENLRGVYRALVKVHPLISLRVEQDSPGAELAVRIDDKDKPGFDFESLKKVAPAFEKRTGRKALVYEDFGVDLIAAAVEEGNYSKDAGLREFGREAFGNDEFLSVIIGDKRSDIPKTLTRTLMAAQKGTSAEQIARDENIPSFNPIDVRDFSIALAEAHRIARSG
ncbi:MAG: hypothetical protein JXQ83_07860 [Candidatus Glassbacteria bacterium]|nr:hypothetical protein [Candidatus Glassbacteria bacterium]